MARRSSRTRSTKASASPARGGARRKARITKATKATKAPSTTSSAPRRAKPEAPTLLSGGNPQIAKADGEAPVRAYIAAMPGWKRGVGQRLDAIVVRTVPGVRKAVRWNTPFYGVEEGGPGGEVSWFFAFHCITRYVKVSFFAGASLDPVPPVESKVPGVRYVHLHEGEAIDEALFERWIRQAVRLPGMSCF